MKVSIVIPTYNHCDDLLRPCVNSIIKYSNMVDVELIISANGCVDNTVQYIKEIYEQFESMGIPNNLKLAWSDKPTGYSRACNDGIKIATHDKIILLNNDVLILEQIKHTWIDLLCRQFEFDPKCGITGPSKVFSDPAGRNFLIFFCVMIDRKVFNTIGLLNEEYGKGGGEDTEFCILAEDSGFNLNICTNQTWSNQENLYVGEFPIYHKGEGTVHDLSLVPDYADVFHNNSLLLGKKFNPEWYRWKLSNNLERAVYLKGHQVDIREKVRYSWAANNIKGNNVLDIGCSSGYGAQFFAENVNYTGIDYDAKIIEEANAQKWLPNTKFIHSDLTKFENNFANTYFDTIVAFEVIEHLPNGLSFVEILKQHCDHLIVTVPFNESVNVFNPHHLLRNLTPDKFKDFKVIGLINLSGDIIQIPDAILGEEYSLLIEWNKPSGDLSWLNEKHPEMYAEVIAKNVYDVSEIIIKDRNVLDIGANIGAFSLFVNQLGAKKIISVEPTHESFFQLVENINRVGKTNIIALMNAVSDVSGKIITIAVDGNSGLNSLYGNNVGRINYSTTISLHDLLLNFEDDPKIFLKIDCEGAEYDILMDASQEDMNKIDDIAIEVHWDMHPTYKGIQILNDKLTNFGFKLINHKQMYFWKTTNSVDEYDIIEMPVQVQFWTRG